MVLSTLNFGWISFSIGWAPKKEEQTSILKDGRMDLGSLPWLHFVAGISWFKDLLALIICMHLCCILVLCRSRFGVAKSLTHVTPRHLADAPTPKQMIAPCRLRIDRIADLSSEATTFGKSLFISWYFLKIALQPIFLLWIIIVPNSVLVWL